MLGEFLIYGAAVVALGFAAAQTWVMHSARKTRTQRVKETVVVAVGQMLPDLRLLEGVASAGELQCRLVMSQHDLDDRATSLIEISSLK